jgi:predicted nucleotidyltransferase
MITIKPAQFKVLKALGAGKLHLRAVARAANLHEPSASAALQALEKSNILFSEKQGNQKLYSLKPTQNSYAVLSLLDLERLQSLPRIRQSAIHYFLDKLEKPIFAVVFGSTAKDTFKEDSDLDILLVTNKKTPTQPAQKHAEALTGIRVNALQMTLEDFRMELRLKQEPVIQAALKTGFPVFNAAYFHEVLFEHA